MGFYALNISALQSARISNRILHWLYAAAFVGTLAAMNPWGATRGAIWTSPRVACLIAVAIFNSIFFLSSHRSSRAQVLPQSILNWMWVWLAFCAFGMLSTFTSPDSARSYWGQEELGDGLFYWILIAGFSVSNAVILSVRPALYQLQEKALMVGGALCAVLTLPQLIQWKIDYTATSGMTAGDPEQLMSGTWIDQMPISTLSHRGHLSFVLAAAAVLVLVSLLNRPLGVWPRRLALALVLICLGFARTRGAIIAFGAAQIYLMARFWRSPVKRTQLLTSLGISALLGLALLVILSLSRPYVSSMQGGVVDGMVRVQDLNTERPIFWSKALTAIKKRPLNGWGFDGFGLAYPYIMDCKNPVDAPYCWDGVQVREVVAYHDTEFDYIGSDGKKHTGAMLTNKAHNQMLDTALSVGLPGVALFLFLLALAFKASFCSLPSESGAIGIEAVLIVYLVYGVTWFDCAQFTHLAWWAASVGFGLEDHQVA